MAERLGRLSLLAAFAGIKCASVLAFKAVQLVAAVLATGFFRRLLADTD